MMRQMDALRIFTIACLALLVACGQTVACSVGNCADGDIKASATADPVYACVGQAVTLSVNASDCDLDEFGEEQQDTLVFDWTFGDGGTAHVVGNSSVTHTYISLGQKNVTVKVNDLPIYYNDPMEVTVTFNVELLGGVFGFGGPCDKNLLLENYAGGSLQDSYQAKPGQPQDTTYKWDIIEGGAVIVGTDTDDVVHVMGTAVGNVRLRLTYTNGDRTCEYVGLLKVQKPDKDHSPLSSADCTGDLNVICSVNPPRYSVERHVVYTVKDQDGIPVPKAYWVETWPAWWPLNQRNDRCGCDGTITDYMWVTGSIPCDGSSSVYLSGTQTIKVSGWPETGNFWGPWTVEFRYNPHIYHSGCGN